jgi:hypothetical protein
MSENPRAKAPTGNAASLETVTDPGDEARTYPITGRDEEPGRARREPEPSCEARSAPCGTAATRCGDLRCGIRSSGDSDRTWPYPAGRVAIRSSRSARIPPRIVSSFRSSRTIWQDLVRRAHINASARHADRDCTDRRCRPHSKLTCVSVPTSWVPETNGYQRPLRFSRSNHVCGSWPGGAAGLNHVVHEWTALPGDAILMVPAPPGWGRACEGAGRRV